MGKSQETFNKKEKEKKRLKKRQEKQQKKEERKANSDGGGLENMLAYVDENGVIVDTPPDPTKKTKVKAADIELGVPKREEEEPVEHVGRVDYYDSSKGFGFIIEDVSNEKYFFHVNNTLEEIGEADRVAYDVEQGPRGLNAVNVKKS